MLTSAPQAVFPPRLFPASGAPLPPQPGLEASRPPATYADRKIQKNVFQVLTNRAGYAIIIFVAKTKRQTQIRSHGSVGSPFCTDYINSVLPVPAKLPLLMGCADCTKIGSKIWSHGSVGRAHRSHRWGHRFESCCDHQPEKVLRNQGFFFFYSPLQRVHFPMPAGCNSRCAEDERLAGQTRFP